MALFNELKRRNVFRIGAAYLVASWLLIEVSSLIFDIYGAPGWVSQVIVALLAIGLPIALFFAWAFEITPEGIKREAQVDRSQSITPVTAKRLDVITIVLLVAAVGVLAMDRFVLEAPAPRVTAGVGGDGRASIAVLPFVNMSGNAENEYFSDGLTETLLHMLAQVSELRVAARTSAFAFKGTNMDVREIATQLGVATVLEGSVQRAGERVRVTAQLIDARDGSHLWSGSYDRTLEDIFAIQDEIADEVADALTQSLLGTSEHQRVAAVGTRNTAAYDLYLRGLDRMYTASYTSLPEAVRYFQDALDEDGSYDDARVALAATYLSMTDTGLLQPRDAAASMRAALAPMLSRVTVSPQAAGYAAWADLLAVNYAVDDELRTAVGARLDAALVRAPDDPGLLELAGNFAGRFLRDEARAMRLLEHALEVDPLNGDLLTSYGFRLLAAERFDDALNIYARMREVVPGHSFGYLGPAVVAERRGELADAILWSARAMAVDRRDHEIPAGVADYLIQLGMIAEATPWLRRAELLNATGDDTLRIGIIHAYLSGDTDRALALAEGVVRARNQNRRGLYRIAVNLFTRIMHERGALDAAVAVLESVAPGMTAARLAQPPRDPFDAAVVVNAAPYLAPQEDAATRRARAETVETSLRSIFLQFDPDDSFRGFQARLAGDVEAGRAALVADLLDVTNRGWRWQVLSTDPLAAPLVDHPEVQAALAELARRNAAHAERYRAYVAAGEINVP